MMIEPMSHIVQKSIPVFYSKHEDEYQYPWPSDLMVLPPCEWENRAIGCKRQQLVQNVHQALQKKANSYIQST
jgi:hypothetical protein